MFSFVSSRSYLQFSIDAGGYFDNNKIFSLEMYYICIPSYRRAKICNEKTLSMLKRNKISNSLIYVFVVKEEENEYLQILDKNSYYKIVVGKKGICAQREYIESYFKDGTNIVCLDDDVEEVDLSLSDTFKNKSLDFFYKSAFDLCKKSGSFIFGVYPVYNPFFRTGQREVTTDLRYVVGAMFGVIIRRKVMGSELKYTITPKFNGQKEDVEKSILYYKLDGVLLRFNRIGFITKYYGTDGGGNGKFQDRLEDMRLASLALEKKYPQYGKVYTRKNGMTEFRLGVQRAKTKPKKSRSKKKLRSRKRDAGPARARGSP